MSLLKVERLKAVIEFGPVRSVSDAEKDCEELYEWTRELLIKQ
jgi:hypothetical protein